MSIHGPQREPSPRPHHLEQAPVRPLDVDGITATVVGTVAFAVATVLMLLLRGRLQARGDGWWLWVGVAGVVLGLVGNAYCRRRAARR